VSTIVPTWRGGLTAAGPRTYNDGHNYRRETDARDLLHARDARTTCSRWSPARRAARRAATLAAQARRKEVRNAIMVGRPRLSMMVSNVPPCQSREATICHSLQSIDRHLNCKQTDGKVVPLSTALGRSNPTARSAAAASCAAKRAQVASCQAACSTFAASRNARGMLPQANPAVQWRNIRGQVRAGLGGFAH
jgi:hypothetical protein